MLLSLIASVLLLPLPAGTSGGIVLFQGCIRHPSVSVIRKAPVGIRPGIFRIKFNGFVYIVNGFL
jgi:hypothetical protein